MDKDNKSIKIIKDLCKITNENNINNSSSSFSFTDNDLINDYFKEMKKGKLWFIQSFKFKLKKFLRLYTPHLFLFLKKVKRFNENK